LLLVVHVGTVILDLAKGVSVLYNNFTTNLSTD